MNFLQTLYGYKIRDKFFCPKHGARLLPKALSLGAYAKGVTVTRYFEPVMEGVCTICKISLS